MSYILEALKKSERKRMQGAVPDVLAAQEVAYREPKTRRLWPYIIIVALIINALAVVWLAPWKSRKSDVVVEIGPVTKVASKEGNTVPADAEKQSGAGIAAVAPGDTGVGKPSAETKPVRGDDMSRRRLPAVKVEAQKMMSGIEKPESVVKADHDTRTEAPPEAPAMAPAAEPEHPVDVLPIPDKVYSLSELPFSIQEKLPSFHISVFLYSEDPASRMVKINNKMLRQGDYLSEGLRLEEIEQNSLILGYQNFRFRVGLK
jgi:general secretion pathway protein B